MAAGHRFLVCTFTVCSFALGLTVVVDSTCNAWCDEPLVSASSESHALAPAQSAEDTNHDGIAQPAAAPVTTASGKMVEGSVKVIELNLELLKEVGLDIKDVIKAAGGLYDEVNIRPVQIITEPEVVGRGTIVYMPIGTRPIGPPAPPRKKRLDLAVNQIDPVIAALKQDVDDVRAGRTEIAISDAVQEQLQPLFKDWGLTVDDIDGQLSALHNLTAAPPYDNAAISARATSIAVDAEKLDQTRRKIYKILQKEGKKRKQ